LFLLLRSLALFFILGLFSSCGFTVYKNPGTKSNPPGNAKPDSEGSPTESHPEFPPEATFSQIRTQILEPQCLKCHGAGDYPDLSTYSAFADDPNLIVPGNAKASPFYQILVRGRMPRGAPRLTPPFLEMIEKWINEGALDN
jgi:hypothetical protein